MDLMNLFNLLTINNEDELCASLAPILRIVGIVILGIKIVVPIILIIVGMFDMAKAVTEKDEGKIKEAQSKLIKKAIAAVLVFLVATIVTVLMQVVGDEKYDACMTCINNPGSCATTTN